MLERMRYPVWLICGSGRVDACGDCSDVGGERRQFRGGGTGLSGLGCEGRRDHRSRGDRARAFDWAVPEQDAQGRIPGGQGLARLHYGLQESGEGYTVTDWHEAKAAGRFFHSDSLA